MERNRGVTGSQLSQQALEMQVLHRSFYMAYLCIINSEGFEKLNPLRPNDFQRFFLKRYSYAKVSICKGSLQ